MNKVVAALLSLAVLALSGCDNPFDKDAPQKTVSFTVDKFSMKNKTTGASGVLSEIRIIGDFNNWGNNSGTDKDAVWNNAEALTWNETGNKFELNKDFDEGKTIKYTFIAKYTDSSGSVVLFDWINPGIMFIDNKALFTPYNSLEDNGMGNGAKNAVYKVN